MKPLPTEYGGVTFRSRLEADWALTLDTLDISWEYEPEGFELTDGSRYAPDFWLPAARAWLEVKGDHLARYSKVEQFAADLWAESGATTTYDPQAPMVLVGRSPDTDQISRLMATGGLTRIVGIMGPGKAYSVGLVRCPVCRRGTVIALWQPACRGCGTEVEDWHGSWVDGIEQGFKRVPRPIGR